MVRAEFARSRDQPIQIIVSEKPCGGEEGVGDALDVADIVIVVSEVLEAPACSAGRSVL